MSESTDLSTEIMTTILADLQDIMPTWTILVVGATLGNIIYNYLKQCSYACKNMDSTLIH